MESSLDAVTLAALGARRSAGRRWLRFSVLPLALAAGAAVDLTRMQLDSNVSEGDIGRLRAGMKTAFTVDSFPGQPFPGAIRQIRNAATTVQSVVTYDAVIDVHNDDLRLRPGMTANVSIVYAESVGVLTVPVAALRFHPPGPPPPSGADRRTAWVLSGGRPQPIAVRTGLSDGTLVEVLEGNLHEGDQVVVEAVGGDSPLPPGPPTGAPPAPPPGPPGGGMFGGPP
jgi:HlyD family secretion protein